MDEELDGDELCEWPRADKRCGADDILHGHIPDHQLASRFAESTLCLRTRRISPPSASGQPCTSWLESETSSRGGRSCESRKLGFGRKGKGGPSRRDEGYYVSLQHRRETGRSDDFGCDLRRTTDRRDRRHHGGPQFLHTAFDTGQIRSCQSRPAMPALPRTMRLGGRERGDLRDRVWTRILLVVHTRLVSRKGALSLLDLLDIQHVS